MANLEQLQSAVSKGVAQLDRVLVGWANPLEADAATRPHIKWALHSLDGALVISVMYLLFVAFALTQKTKEVKAKGASKKMKKVKQSVADKYAAGPILFICMALYNLVQAVLCVWMVVSMVVEFRARGFTTVCNAYDRSAEGVARVLHVFYLSKVCRAVRAGALPPTTAFPGRLERSLRLLHFILPLSPHALPPRSSTSQTRSSWSSRGTGAS